MKNIIIFNKEGYEIPLLTTSNLIFSDADTYDDITDDNLLLFGHYNGEDKYSFNVKIMNSGAFNTDVYNNIISNKNINLNVFLDTKKLNISATLEVSENSFELLYKSDEYIEYSNKDDVLDNFKYYTLKDDEFTVNCDLSEYDLLYPSVVFMGNVDIEKTSTGLVGVETLLFATDIDINGDTQSVSYDMGNSTIKLEIVNDPDNVLKFISCVNENYDEIVKRKTYEITKNDIDVKNYNNYVNIGFFPIVEGTYEFGINIYKDDIKIGYLNINAFAEGEDERYRALFSNFGIEHPKNYHNLFKSQDINEPFVDWNMINKKSKELFLSYDEIFPYVGTYKALINSVKYLGYDDIYFREWYKKINDNEDKEISYRININDNFKDNVTYADVSLDLYNMYRKLNKLTMVYSLSKESDELDEYGVNKLVSSYSQPNEEILIKLIALREWLHKNIIAVNCKIVDITGEGIVCERYNYITYGINMQNIEYEDTLNINAKVDSNSVYMDASTNTATITVNTIINTDDDLLDFNNFNNLSFDMFNNDNETINNPFIHTSFIKAYVDTSNAIIPINDNGLQLWLDNGKLDFDDTFIGSSVSNVMVDGEQLLSGEDEVVVLNSSVNNLSEAIFTYFPIIQLERGEIKDINISSINKTDKNNTISSKWKNSNVCIIDAHGTESYYIDDIKKIFNESQNDASNHIYTSNDYIVLYPNTDEMPSFKYVYDDIYDVPLFKFKNYKIILYTDNGKQELILNDVNKDTEYTLNIIDGKINIQDPIHQKRTTLNFHYDRINENIKEQNVSATIEYTSNILTPISNENDIKYTISVNNVGEYSLIAYAFNENGNIFSKRISEKVTVLPAIYNTDIYCTEKYIINDNSFYNKDLIGKDAIDTSTIEKWYNNTDNQFYDNTAPLFKNNYRIPEIRIEKDNTNKLLDNTYINYDNISYALELPKFGDYIQLVNLSNKFRINIDNNIIFAEPIVLYDNFDVYVSKKEVLCNLIIYNKLYNNAVAEYNCKLLYNGDNKYILTLIETDVENNEFINTYNNVYSSDKNYQYFIQIIEEFQVNSIFNNPIDNNIVNMHTADLRFNIGDAKVSNIPFRENDKIRIRYNITKLTDNNTFRSEPILDENGNISYEYYKQDGDIYKQLLPNNMTGKTISIIYSPPLNTYIDKDGIKYNKIFTDDSSSNKGYDSYASYNVISASSEKIRIDNNFNFTNKDYDREYVIIDAGDETVKNDDDEQSTKTIYENHYIVRFGDNDNVLEYVYIDSKSIKTPNDDETDYYLSDSKISLYVSFAHNAYVKYIMPVKSSIEKDDQTINIFTDKNRLYHYIDRTFSCIPSKFNVTNAYKYWIDNYDDIKDLSFYKYNEPITLRSDKSHERYEKVYMKPYIIAKSDNNYMTHWRLYKHNSTNNTRTLVMEVKNNNLFIKLFDSGIYDIVAYNYDKYGNLSIIEKQACIYIN